MWVTSFFISLLMLTGVLPFHLALQISKTRVALERRKCRKKRFSSNKVNISVHLCRRMGLNMRATVTAPQYTCPSSKLPRPDHSWFK